MSDADPVVSTKPKTSEESKTRRQPPYHVILENDEDHSFEFVISVPGYPQRVEGRRAVADLYRGYGNGMVLDSADGLAVHRDPETSVVVLEYAGHGRAVRTGRAYDNHFVSVITIKGRTVTRWRDYLDPVAVFQAIGWPPAQDR